MDRMTMINDLLAKKDQSIRALEGQLAAAKAGNGALSAEQRASVKAHEDDISALQERITELREQQAADDASAPMQARYAPSAGWNPGGAAPTDKRALAEARYGEKRSAMPGTVKVTREPEVYRREDARTSYFADLLAVNTNNDSQARERLNRNNAMQRDRAAQNGEQRAPLSTTNGAGGEFVPPLWLENQFVKFARPRRIFADLAQNAPLPAGTDQLFLPRVLTGTATATQSAQNSAIQETDLTTTSVNSPVATIAGGQTVSLQLIEQSPLNIDDVVLADLAADYATQLDKQLLNGSGSGGVLQGVIGLSGINSVTFSGTTLTGAGGLYSALAQAISKVNTTRFEAPTAIVMHGRRWMWMLEQPDTNTGRPLIVPAQNGVFNGMGVLGSMTSDGPVGEILGVPVYVDNNVPTNLGAGTNEDRVIVLKADDLFLWESHIRAEAFQQTYSQNMSVFIRLYNYAAWIPNRYPSSISVISGTGLNILP
jgi:HK97 family phage major capsid protein